MHDKLIAGRACPAKKSLRRCASRLAFAPLLALMLTGCGGDADSENAASAEPSSATASADGAGRSGDAATNPACALVEAADVQKILPDGEKLTEINGTTTPGRFAANSHNCFWITNGASPWLVSVNLEENLGPRRDEALASVQETIDMGVGKLSGLGDLAVTPPAAVRLVAGQRYLMVQVSANDTGRDSKTATDQAVELARAALAG